MAKWIGDKRASRLARGTQSRMDLVDPPSCWVFWGWIWT